MLEAVSELLATETRTPRSTSGMKCDVCGRVCIQYITKSMALIFQKRCKLWFKVEHSFKLCLLNT